jgi:hypothetical protein
MANPVYLRSKGRKGVTHTDNLCGLVLLIRTIIRHQFRFRKETSNAP